MQVAVVKQVEVSDAPEQGDVVLPREDRDLLEARFKGSLGVLSGWYWEQGEDLRFIRVECATRAGTDFDLRGCLGKTLRQAGLTPATTADADEHQAAVEAREPFREVLLRQIAPTGQRCYFRVSGAPVFDRAARFQGYRGIALDVTAEVRAERLLRLEHLVARCLTESIDAPAALKTIIRAVCETQEWLCGRYFRVDTDTATLRFSEAWSVADPAAERFIERSRDLSFAPGAGLNGLVWQSGQALWVADQSQDSRVFFKDLHRDASTRGAFVFPVTADGQTIGVLGFFSHEIREPDERLLAAARTIGGQIGQFLQRKQAEADLARKNSILATQLETSLDAVLLVNENAHIVSYNRKFVELWAIPEDIVRAGDDGPVLDMVVAQMEDPQAFVARVKWLYEHRQEESQEEIRTSDGRIIDRFTAPVESTDGEYYGRVWYFRDVTELKRAEVRLKRTNRVLHVIDGVSQSLILRKDEGTLVQDVCRLLLERGGYRLAWIGVVDDRDRDRIRTAAHGEAEAGVSSDAMIDALKDCGPSLTAVRTGRLQVCQSLSTDSEMADVRRAALAFACSACAFAPLVGNGSVLGVLAVASMESFDGDELSLLQELAAKVAFGISLNRSNAEHERAVARAERLALFDALTELPNRIQLLRDIDLTMQQCESGVPRFAVLAIDIPRIESLKSGLGFGASDTLVMTIAARLKDVCSEKDVIARLEGSEFAIRLDPESSVDADAALAGARRIRAALELPCQIGTTEVMPRCLIGIAMYPVDGEDGATLLEHAQTARSGTSSSSHRNCDISFFGPQKSAHVVRELGLEAALRQAVVAGELRLMYQPEVDLHTGEIVSVEALLRWNSRQFGNVTPGEFIPLAERSDLILSVGAWVLREACRQAAAWRQAGLAAPRIAVNLSVRQVVQPGFAAMVQQIALNCGVDPSWLGLEITESVLIEDVAHVSETLRQLKAIGFELSIDDFGTGYSSLSRLRDLPIDVVKIDRGFVPDVTAAPQDVSVTRAIITMAHSLQLRVLAEGVETEGQLSLLATHGCDLIQGNLFSEAVPAMDIEAMLRENRRLPERFVARSASSRTLLLVDDEENILSALRRLLRRDGYQIICARSAAEGLQRLGESQVGVILSDQRMPGMTGVEFLRRAKDLYPDTVRMVLSGFTDLQSIIDAVNEGAIYKFLTKPWDDEHIRTHILDAFRHKEMADENRRLAREVEDANGRLERLNRQLQQSLQQQSDQSNVLQQSADSAREILDSIPAAIIGIDPEGLITFVSGGAREVVAQVSSAIGRAAAAALPPSFLHLLRNGASSVGHVDCGDRQLHAVVRTLEISGILRGRLIILLPVETSSEETLA